MDLPLYLVEQLHLFGMGGQSSQDGRFRVGPERGYLLLWMSGAWIAPFLGALLWGAHLSEAGKVVVLALAVLAAPLPAILYLIRIRRRMLASAAKAEDEVAQAKLQLDTVRYRTTRLREELQAADRQSRLSHQLTLLGQFTAGFLHEFNNPLAIVAGRLEVLLEERKQDAPLCADLEQMLKEARYMSSIAGTLLQALRRERGGEVFEASDPQKALQEAVKAYCPAARAQKVELVEEYADVPRVDVPEHVVGEVVRGLISNSLQALKGREDGGIWARIETYRTAGARVLVRIEDNGPGVPEEMRNHLFEPFASQSSGRERLGLGLFLAASLLDMYDGRIRHEMRYGGGASFVVELPPARFTRGQPYHWFAGGTQE